MEPEKFRNFEARKRIGNSHEACLGEVGLVGRPLGAATDEEESVATPPFSDGTDFLTAGGPRREGRLFLLGGWTAWVLIVSVDQPD